MNHEDRIRRVRETLPEVDALLITNLTNVRYLTGFSGTNGQVLIDSSRAVFLSDPRYEARAKDLVEDAEIVIYELRITEVLGDLLREAGVARLGIEAGTMSVAERDDLAKRLGSVEVVSTENVVEGLRRVKDPDEIALIRKAIALGDRTFDEILGVLEPGMTERDVALEIELFMRRNGADAVSFDPIVGSGPLSAHVHHSVSERALEKGDVVLLDFGARVDGYCSDLTRTVVLGPATDEQKRLYDTVLAANRAGIEAVEVGRGCADVDGAARRLIEAAGFGECFGHGLGHGVGLDIHEAPRLNHASEASLMAGDVVTIEPGIYVPGNAGFRVEDCLLVTENGAEVLTTAPKDKLIEL